MRLMVRSMAGIVALLLLGTASVAARVDAIGTAPADDCYRIDGVWYCPCEWDDCGPPDCEFIDGRWYCPDN